MSTDLPYSFQFLESATETLRAIAHPHRLLIVEMLFQQKSLNVTEIYERLGIEQAVASHHLRILKDRGVVQVRRDGKNSNYSLTSDDYFKILEVLDKVLDWLELFWEYYSVAVVEWRFVPNKNRINRVVGTLDPIFIFKNYVSGWSSGILFL